MFLETEMYSYTITQVFWRKFLPAQELEVVEREHSVDPRTTK